MIQKIRLWVRQIFEFLTRWWRIWIPQKAIESKETKINCANKDHHHQYITFEELKNDVEKYKKELLSYQLLTTNVQQPESNLNDPQTSSTMPDNTLLSHSEFQTFLVNMAKLTGLLIVYPENGVPWPGTGFILKLKRQRDSQCPCPIIENHMNTKTEHAIVTISTAYHMFNDTEGEVKRFAEVNEIWEHCKTQLYLYYDLDVEDITKLKEVEGLKTLYGHKLVEMDKDLDYDCDWCAIECVTHDLDLIETLEQTISDYQRGLAELYKKSQTDQYKKVNLVVIIGHPHNWAKRISIGQAAPIKEILKEVRSKQMWYRYNYTNLTCGGSSGSPIFKWGQPITGFGYWFGHPHNHSRLRGYLGESTIGVENIY